MWTRVNLPTAEEVRHIMEERLKRDEIKIEKEYLKHEKKAIKKIDKQIANLSKNGWRGVRFHNHDSKLSFRDGQFKRLYEAIAPKYKALGYSIEYTFKYMERETIEISWVEK